MNFPMTSVKQCDRLQVELEGHERSQSMPELLLFMDTGRNGVRIDCFDQATADLFGNYLRTDLNLEFEVETDAEKVSFWLGHEVSLEDASQLVRAFEVESIFSGTGPFDPSATLPWVFHETLAFSHELTRMAMDEAVSFHDAILWDTSYENGVLTFLIEEPYYMGVDQRDHRKVKRFRRCTELGLIGAKLEICLKSEPSLELFEKFSKMKDIYIYGIRLSNAGLLECMVTDIYDLVLEIDEDRSKFTWIFQA